MLLGIVEREQPHHKARLLVCEKHLKELLLVMQRLQRTVRLACNTGCCLQCDLDVRQDVGFSFDLNPVTAKGPSTTVSNANTTIYAIRRTLDVTQTMREPPTVCDLLVSSSPSDPC